MFHRITCHCKKVQLPRTLVGLVMHEGHYLHFSQESLFSPLDFKRLIYIIITSALKHSPKHPTRSLTVIEQDSSNSVLVVTTPCHVNEGEAVAKRRWEGPGVKINLNTFWTKLRKIYAYSGTCQQRCYVRY